jgi:AraC-like DNA-binding protein
MVTHSVVRVEKQVETAGSHLVYQPSRDWFTIVVLHRGLGCIEGYDGSVWRGSTLTSGDSSLIAPDRLVRLRGIEPSSQAFDVISVSLPTTAFEEAMRSDPSISVRDLDVLHTLRVFDPVVASVVRSLSRTEDSPEGSSYVKSATQYLVTHLLHPGQRDNKPIQNKALSPDPIIAVIIFMREHLATPITLDQLAARAAFSRYHFIRKFAAATGLTPMQYLTDLRIEAARTLLATGIEPIARVGSLCGFASAANFARAFRNEVGCSPSLYRKNAQSD